MTNWKQLLHADALQWFFQPDQPLLTMIRSGLDGLTDDEYLWEPVAGSWSVGPRSEPRTPVSLESLPEGDWSLDIEYPDPEPAPFTTVAWRMTHMTGSVYVAAASLRGHRQPDGTVDLAWQQHRAVPTTAAAAVERWNDAACTLRSHLDAATPADLVRLERQSWEPEPHPVWEHVGGERDLRIDDEHVVGLKGGKFDPAVAVRRPWELHAVEHDARLGNLEIGKGRRAGLGAAEADLGAAHRAVVLGGQIEVDAIGDVGEQGRRSAICDLVSIG